MASVPNSPAGPRPKRFPLELPLEVRVAGSTDWWSATAEDISANGICFRVANYVPPRTAVDVKLQLPAALTGHGAVRLQCSGYVVRSNQPSMESHEARVAVAFLDFHIAGVRTAVEAQREQIAQVRREVGDLIHRLNSLLFIIMANAELITGDPRLESNVRDYATHSMNASDEASRIVRSLAAALKKIA